MRERNLGDSRGKDGVTAGKEDRRGGRLCEESRGKEKEKNVHQRPRETNGPKSRAADGKGKVGGKGGNRVGGVKPNNMLVNHEAIQTAMVVPRTPVAPRNQDKPQEQGNQSSLSLLCIGGKCFREQVITLSDRETIMKQSTEMEKQSISVDVMIYCYHKTFIDVAQDQMETI